MEMNNTNLNNFRNDLQESLKSLEKKYGIQLEAGKITYNNIGFTIKVDAINGDNEYEAGKNSYEYWVNNFAYGEQKQKLEQIKVGDYFQDGNKKYMLKGALNKYVKMPLILQTPDKKEVVCSPQYLIKLAGL